MRLRALAVWTDTRGGSDVSNKQDLALGVVAYSDGSPLRQPLRLAGGALSVAPDLVAALSGRREGVDAG